MPQTQTVEFFAAPSQTVTAKLFSPGSETEIASVTATEQTNRKGVYRAVYTDVAAGLYRLLALASTTPIATWWTDLTLTTATFQAYEVPTSVFSASGSTDWTLAERSALRSILGFDTGGSVTDPSIGILDTIRDKTNLITSTNVSTAGPVTTTGDLRGPILIGDDYLAANGRAFVWTVAAIPGITPGTSTARFGGKYGSTTWLVTGTVTDNGNGTWTLSCDMTRTVSGALVPGVYDWSVEILSNGGTEITPVRSGKPVAVATKLT
jgi:hypothetical protein